VNLQTVLVGLHVIAFGRQIGLNRQNVRPARRGLPKQRIDPKRPRTFPRQLAVHRHCMAAKKSPRGVGRQMNNRLAGRLLRRCPLRAQRHQRQQRTAIADRGAQIGGRERRDGLVAVGQKRFRPGARQSAGEHGNMLFAGNGEHRTPRK